MSLRQDVSSAAGNCGDRTDGRRDAVVTGVALTAEQRVAVEKVIAIGVRWTVGARSDLLPSDPVAELHAVTRDPVVFGVALGTASAAAEMDGWKSYRELAELYRRAGADERVAAVELAWRRDRSRHDGSRR